MATQEAFVYCWTDHASGMLYVGSHKGTPDDGYVCSSKYMLEEYKERPKDFTRQIIAFGREADIRKFECEILSAENAAKNPNYYNQHNGDGKFYVVWTEDRRKEQAKRQEGRIYTQEVRRNMSDKKVTTKVEEHGRVCTICKEFKLWKDFRPKKSGCFTGYRSFCRKCENLKSRDGKRRRRAESPPKRIGRKPQGKVTDFGRECPGCGEYKSWDNYYKRPNVEGSKASDFSSRCNICARKAKRESKRRAKERKKNVVLS